MLISVQEATDVASARRVADYAAKRAGMDGEQVSNLGIVVTELASNLIKHAGGGEMVLRDISKGGAPGIEAIALDKGRGMSNIGQCFKDGYSTAGGAGTGLGAIARISAFYDMYSSPGKGTAIVARVGAAVEAVPQNDALHPGAINIPFPGEEVSGDAWVCDASSGRIRFVVVDGLGHGIFAAEAATAVIQMVGDGRGGGPLDFVERAHATLRATRGAAIAVVDVDIPARTATYAGVGNVAGAIVSDDMEPSVSRRQMVSVNGTLGHELRNAREYQYPITPESLLVIHSDGLSTHWSLGNYPGLFSRDPSVVAGVLFRDFRRQRDDATVLVARLGRA